MPSDNKGVRQAIILAGGEGKRLSQLGKIYPKISLPIGNIPLFQFHLRTLIQNGISDLIFVLDPLSTASGLPEKILQSLYQLDKNLQTKCRFMVQNKAQGIAKAVKLCEGYTKDRFIILLGDTFFNVRSFAPAIHRLSQEDLDVILSVRFENDLSVIQKECTVQVSAGGYAVKLIEKPLTPLSRIKPCGIYFLSRKIFQVIEQTPTSHLRGEVELTDAIASLTSQKRVKIAFTIRHDININYLDDYLMVNRYYLKMHHLDYIGESLPKDLIIHRSVIGKNVFIGQRCRIEDSVVLDGSTIPDYSTIIGGVFMGKEMLPNE